MNMAPKLCATAWLVAIVARTIARTASEHGEDGVAKVVANVGLVALACGLFALFYLVWSA